MARIPTFTPRSVTKNKRTYWDLDIPKAFDPNPDADKKKRQRKRYETKTEALNAARRYRNRWRDLGRHGITLTPEQASEAHKAFQLIEASGRSLYLSSVIEEALKAIEILEEASLKDTHDLSLVKASKHLVEHYKYKEQAHTFEEAYNESINKRIDEFSSSHRKDTQRIMFGPKRHPLSTDDDRIKERGFLTRFGKAYIHEVKDNDIEDWIKKNYRSKYEHNKAITIINPIFKYALQKQWINVNPMGLIKKKKTKSKTRILSIREFTHITELIQIPEYESIAPAMAIMMFAGIRYEELAGNQDHKALDWNKVITNPRGAHKDPYIQIDPLSDKTDDGRLVDIMPNLIKWIEMVPKSQRRGKVIGTNFFNKYKRLRAIVGIQSQSRIFRHSFGTYHYHKFKNRENTMFHLGHTNTKTFIDHYYAYNPQDDAPYLYWELLPEGAKKETKIVEPDFQSVAT